MDKTLRGPQPTPYYHCHWHRLAWEEAKVRAPYSEHWLCFNDNQLVGEFFKGKSGFFFGIAYMRNSEPLVYSIRSRNRDMVLNAMSATVLGPSN